nr:uncharacterized protein LOC113822815 isoform X2 [Penaeus vannamei]
MANPVKLLPLALALLTGGASLDSTSRRRRWSRNLESTAMANPVKLLPLALALLTALTDGAVIKNETERASNCPAGYHECMNENCIPNSWVCDGYLDCYHGEDEDNCWNTDTTMGYTTSCNGFTCHNGNCIPGSYVCDGASDCPWGEDEEQCGSSDYPSTHYPTTDYPTTDYPTTDSPPAECSSPFDLVGGKCILVDIFESVTWAEARYLCEKFGADLVTLESLSFYTALLDFLNSKGLAGHDYWVGANDTETEGEWAWLDGTPVRMGTPLWALYRYSSNDYEQEPTTSSSSSSSGRLRFLDKTRFLFMDDGDCDSAKAAICQLLPGASASAGNSEPQPKRRPRRRQ